jgi:hypothetical protein
VVVVYDSKLTKAGFFGKIGEYLKEYEETAKKYAAGLFLIGMTLLVSSPKMPANYLFAEEPANQKKVITIENREPEKKPEEKKPEEKPVVKEAKKEDFGIQIYDPLQLYKSPALRLDGQAGRGEYDFRIFAGWDCPEPKSKEEESILRPENLFLNVNGGNKNDKDDGSEYDRLFYNYILGSKSRLGLSYYNGGRDRTSRDILTPSDETKQTTVKEFDGFANNIYLPKGILALQYANLKSEDGTDVKIIQPIQLTVKTDVQTEENKFLAGYNHMLDKNLSLGGNLSIAKASAQATVDGASILDKKWKTWQLGANLYKLNENVVWYFGPNATQGDEVAAAYKWGGDAFLLKPLGKGWLSGLELGRCDGMNLAGFILGKVPLDDMARYNKRMIDLHNEISLTKEQKELAERDYLKALASNSGLLFEFNYDEQVFEKGGYSGFTVIPVSKKIHIVGRGELGRGESSQDSYGSFMVYTPGEGNRLSFDLGFDRINPENDKGSWTVNIGLTYWFGDGKKQNDKDGKDGKK